MTGVRMTGRKLLWWNIEYDFRLSKNKLRKSKSNDFNHSSKLDVMHYFFESLLNSFGVTPQDEQKQLHFVKSDEVKKILVKEFN